jgi:hypothetical protein
MTIVKIKEDLMVIHGESILATVKLTEDEYKDISILHYKYIKKGGKKHLFILIFLLFLSGLSVVGSFQNQNIPSSGIESEMIYSKSFPEIISRCIITFIILIAILGIQIYTPYLIKKSAVKEFRSNAVAQKEINYLFSAENIGIESEDFHMKLRYEDIHKVVVLKNYIIIFESDKLIRVLPKKSFETDDTVLSALQLLENNLSKDKYETHNV